MELRDKVLALMEQIKDNAEWSNTIGAIQTYQMGEVSMTTDVEGGVYIGNEDWHACLNQYIPVSGVVLEGITADEFMSLEF